MTRRIITVLFTVSIIGGAIWWALPKRVTPDYIDVTITKIEITQRGQITLSAFTTSSRETPVSEALYDDDTFLGGGRSSGGTSGNSSITFSLNPEETPIKGRFEDTIQFKRLLVYEGQQKHLLARERLYYYDFKTADGVRHYGYIEAGFTR